MPENFSREQEERRFVNAIDRAFTNGGSVLIPVFALGKTQEVLAIIYKFRREKLLGDFPLYIGGLSTGMTEIYDERSHGTRRQWPRLQLLPELDPFVLTGKTIGEAPPRGGRVYALSSGMMTPKTLSNIFRAPHYRKSQTFDFLRRLRRPGFAGWNFESGAAWRPRHARSRWRTAGSALQHRGISI